MELPFPGGPSLFDPLTPRSGQGRYSRTPTAKETSDRPSTSFEKETA
jgi:hypothetical protein